MALHYLSGDYGAMGKGKKKSGGAKKHAAKKPHKAAHKGKLKAKIKKGFKIAKKIGVAPARGAFETAVALNLLKLATKLARIWNKPNGKERLKKFWENFGGDINHLKKQIIKGSKQQISGDRIGIAVETILATATPIVIALVPIIKEFKASGGPQEEKEFNQGLTDAKTELANSPEFADTTVKMPEGKEVAVVDNSGTKDTSGGGGGGTESSGGGGGGTESGGGGGGAEESGGGATDEKATTDAEKKATPDEMKGLTSPLGFYFKILMLLMLLPPNISHTIFFMTVSTLAFLGIVLLPFKKYSLVNAYINAPFKLINYFRYGKETKKIGC